MDKSISLLIGLRFLLAKSSNRFISFISMSAMLGIAVGILVLTIILSAMNGFERELTNKLLSVVPHGEITAVNPPLRDWRATMAQAKQQNNVVGAAPFIKISSLIIQGNDLKGVELIGIDPGLESQVSSISKFVEPAAWSQLRVQTGLIILGQGIIKDLGLALGDKVHLMLPQPAVNGRLTTPKSVSFTLAGAFKFGGKIDYTQAYINLDDARNITGSAQGVDGIRLKFADVFSAQLTTRQVALAANKHVYVSDWTRTQGHLYTDIKMVKLITYIVLFLVIGVASFNIVSTLVMAVQDKESEIAILLTMGLTQARVMRIFIVQGMLNALLGCLLGGVSGYLVATNLAAIMATIESLFGLQFLSGDVYFIDFLPSQFQWQDLALLIGVTLVISFVATLYPARKAAGFKPALVWGQ